MSVAAAARKAVIAVLVAPIRVYQRWISPAYPATCRFFPSCSVYAIEAMRQRGPIVGLLLTVRRLLKCAPWHPGGIDPVPARSGHRRPASRSTVLVERPASRSTVFVERPASRSTVSLRREPSVVS